MSDASQSRCQLRLSWGDDPAGVRTFASAMAKKNPPLLAWAEPEPSAADVRGRSGRRLDFLPLQRGVPSWPEDLPLVEVRLFWASGALHVVVGGPGCRWARIEETDGDAFARRAYPVFTPRDLARFGMGDAPWATNSLAAVEYWNQGRLAAWRLTLGSDEEAIHA